MEEKILYSMESPFQQEINVKGYYFGKNEGKERSACIVGTKLRYQLDIRILSDKSFDYSPLAGNTVALQLIIG